MKPLIILLTGLIFCSCTSKNNKSKPDTSRTDTTISIHSITKSSTKPITDSVEEFERRIYLGIDELHTGPVFNGHNNSNVFYRILVVPDEENIMLIAEKIAVGDEGGNFKLVKLSRITDDNSALPKFGLSNADSIKFVDSVNIEGYFNGQKKIINLDKLKPYHPFF